jgi:hypothetical protein
MLIVAALSGFDEALDWSREQLQALYGATALESPRLAFNETRYYDSSMGRGLMRQFFAFQGLIEPEQLAAIKRGSNELEQVYARSARHKVARPINLDPGYLTLAKWVLASTKDQAHRIYLAEGIYAEITLQYHAGRFLPLDWTYPDYRREDYQAFLMRARSEYRKRLRGGR